MGSLVVDSLYFTLSSQHEHPRALRIFTCLHLVVKTFLLALEIQSKSSLLISPYNKLPPEETAGILSSILFWWINSFLFRSYRNAPTVGNLPPVDQKILSTPLKSAILRAWDRRGMCLRWLLRNLDANTFIEKPETPWTLPRALGKCLLWPMLAPVVPKLLLIATRYSQPVLIRYVIRYVMSSKVENSQFDLKVMIVFASIVIYVGSAVS
jgi:ATP-binding cassette subfamily C (CFTR/MRP) protein 1